MGIKVLPPDVNESAANFTAVGDDIRFGLDRRPQRRAPTSSTRSSAPARRRAGSPRFEDFLRKVPAVVCNKRTIESLIKAGAFDSLGHTRRGLRRGARGGRRRRRRRQAPGGHRPGSPLRRPRRRRGPTTVRRRAAVPDGRVGQEDAARLRARDARALRLRPPAASASSTSSPARRHLDRRADRPTTGRPDGATVTIAGLISSACSARSPSRATRGRSPRSRTSTARSTCCSSRRPTRPVSHVLAEDLVVVVRGRVNRRDDVPTIFAAGADAARPRRGPGAGPVVVSLPVARCTPPVVERLKDVLGHASRASPRSTCG